MTYHRGRDDGDLDDIPDSELPRHNYRQIRALWDCVEKLDETWKKRWSEMSRAMFGYQDNGSWENGVVQSIADIRSSLESAAKAAENAVPKAADAKKTGDRNLYLGVAIIVLSTLNGIHPGWGATLLKILQAFWTH